MFSTVATTLLSSVIAITLGWLFGRGKSRAEIAKLKSETESLKITNVEKVVKIYENAMAELQKEVHALRDEVRQLRIKLGIGETSSTTTV